MNSLQTCLYFIEEIINNKRAEEYSLQDLQQVVKYTHDILTGNQNWIKIAPASRILFCSSCNRKLESCTTVIPLQNKIFCSRLCADNFGSHPLMNGGHSIKCGICWNEFPIPLMKKLSCSHSFCNNCLRNYTSMLIRNREVSQEKLKCPECPSALRVEEIKALVSPEDFERYERFNLYGLEVANNENLMRCPNPNCDFMCIIDRNTSEFNCPSCKHTYCAKCRELSHPNKNCQELRRGNLEEQLLDRLIEQEGLIRCPTCQAVIQKVSGCRDLICTSSYCNGRSFFCYDCGQRLRYFKEDHQCVRMNRPNLEPPAPKKNPVAKLFQGVSKLTNQFNKKFRDF